MFSPMAKGLRVTTSKNDNGFRCLAVVACKYCGEEFQKMSWNQIYCKKVHNAKCKQCHENYSFVGRPSHNTNTKHTWWLCKSCIKSNGIDSNRKSQKNWPPEKLLAIVNQRKLSMLKSYGGETTLQSLELRSRKEITMENRYNGPHTKSSQAWKNNSASKRANAQGITLEHSLWLTNLFQDKQLLEVELQRLVTVYGRKLSLWELAQSLGNIDEAEISHKMRLLPNLSKKYLSIYESGLELKVVDTLKMLGLKEGVEFFRRRKMPSRKEIDILLPPNCGIEVNDFATHSREFNEAVSQFRFTKGSFKKGPVYHASKKAEAESLGIELFFIWEDEIISDNLPDILQTIVRKVHAKS